MRHREQTPKAPWYPAEFRSPPPLGEDSPCPPPAAGEVLLINPFYAKDPWGSFGKHVLTPSLALTSIAGATPRRFRVSLWDENLLQGPAPTDPFPEVVGITVHLTFARRAYELAHWYGRRGAKVVLGGLHASACPDDAPRYADVVVVGDGVSVWPRVLDDLAWGRARRRYHGSYHRPRSMAAVPGYLAMTALYKRANPLWALLIRRRLVSRVWRPLVEASRRRHLRYRQRLARRLSGWEVPGDRQIRAAE